MSERLEVRIVDLEMTITHLQNDVQQLGQVVIDQQRELDALKTQTTSLENGVEQIKSQAELRDPRAERPPHY